MSESGEKTSFLEPTIWSRKQVLLFSIKHKIDYTHKIILTKNRLNYRILPIVSNNGTAVDISDMLLSYYYWFCLFLVLLYDNMNIWWCEHTVIWICYHVVISLYLYIGIWLYYYINILRYGCGFGWFLLPLPPPLSDVLLALRGWRFF